VFGHAGGDFFAGTEAELAKYASDVVVHGALRETEFDGNLPVCETARDG
jgi:hypothetical protein